MNGLVGNLVGIARQAPVIATVRIGAGVDCRTCGHRVPRLTRKVLWAELVEQWELTAQWARWFDAREGSHCLRCRSSLRSGQLAGAIVDTVNRQTGTSARHLRELFDAPRTQGLSIAEINSAGNLHAYLARCRGLRYSEFGGASQTVPSEDLMRLSYGDGSFDLVTTSDTLEHVPDVDTALREIRRVLRPGGAHVFTTPVVWGRPTRQRAMLQHGAVVHLFPPSHHGRSYADKSDLLVFYEFGDDFPDRCRAAGFDLEIVRDDTNQALVTFVGWRTN